MKTKTLDYNLPKELIAQSPLRRRDKARLLVFDRGKKRITEDIFRSLPKYLKSGDVLVFNKTKVFQARIFAHKENGENIEVLFLKETRNRLWEVLVRGKVKENEELFFPMDLKGLVIKKSMIYLAVNKEKKELLKILEKKGQTPLPPYIKRKATSLDERYYQTIFAKKIGSAAAPTASLHFTKSLLASLKEKGIQIEFITLHVGLGTFVPIKTDNVEQHQIHSEYFEIDKATAQGLNEAKIEKRRIIACGTTVVRALESSVKKGKIVAQKNSTNLFIYPGYKFKFVDALITNFHTPKSSLLALVYAFAGEKNIRKIYSYAIKKKFRFFSYGDGMIIL